jgi:hypothetical protein
MRTPSFGEANLGALSGAVVAAIGGLFAVGIGPAILGHNLALLFGTPILGLVSFIVSGVVGWFIGGQVGPRASLRFRTQHAEMIGGMLSGLIPVILVALWGCYMVMRS